MAQDNFNQIKLKVSKQIEDAFENTTLLEKVADLLATTMRVRIRKGFGCDRFGGDEKKFRALKPATIKGRERLKKRGELLSGEGVSRSNLTATGKLTDAIQGDVTTGKITVKLEENRSDGAKNSDISEGQHDNNRAFFNISGKEYKKLNQDLIREVKKVLGRI